MENSICLKGVKKKKDFVFHNQVLISMFYRELLKDDHDFLIPEVIDELTTTDVLTSEFIEGIPLDKCFEIDQESKNKVLCSPFITHIIITWIWL